MEKRQFGGEMNQRMMRTRKKTSYDCFVHSYRITDRENLGFRRGFRVYMKKKKKGEINFRGR